MNLTLYYSPVTCALVPLIMLKEAGAQFQTVSLNLAKGEQKQAGFTKINPKQKVPALVIDGVTLTENVAIEVFLDQTFPQALILPIDAMAKAQAISLMAWFASGVHTVISPIAFPQWFCDTPGSEEGTRRVAQTKLMAAMKHVDDLLQDKDWFFDSFTAVDAYFFWCWRRATVVCSELANFKNCSRHFEKMLQRESVISALSFEKSIIG